MTPTVLDVARHLIRQRGVPCAEPAFIVAYLEAEVARRPWIGISAAMSRLGRAIRLANETLTPPTFFAHRAGSERAS